jgi:nicotinate phosphoribosyltransferase
LIGHAGPLDGPRQFVYSIAMSDYRLLPYRISLALCTDLYQVTMAYGYWKNGMAEREAVFSLIFRRHPFAGGYTVCAGLAPVMDFLDHFRFEEEDGAYLAGLVGSDGNPLFEADFLDFLLKMEFTCDVDAVPEGTVVFPQEPLVRVKGPIAQCQLLETLLLNQVNFPTLIATKSARVCQAARGDPVLEFGLRRAQGIDGGLTASRAAYIGGCVATSNVLAGKLQGIPVRGTHAHSWVMAFGDELEAFEAYARAMPNNCVFLVDTYNSLRGIEHAIEVGRRLRARGYKLLGIRLDSGDLAYLSREARQKLDAAGFPDAQILASGDLDEDLIENLKQAQGAPIDLWGVGTNLATGGTQSALGGVYKLTAIRDGDAWRDRLKISDQPIKVTNPGLLRARRYRDASGQSTADAIYDEREDLANGVTIVDPLDPTKRKQLGPELAYEELLVPIYRGGARVYESPPLDAIRARTAAQLATFHETHRRLKNPHIYPVGLSESLHERKTAMLLAYREASKG